MCLWGHLYAKEGWLECEQVDGVLTGVNESSDDSWNRQWWVAGMLIFDDAVIDW